MGPRSLSALWVGWLVVELWLASWGQPYQGATAPEAYSGMRPTIAHLLATTRTAGPAAGDLTTLTALAGEGRVLSLSNLTWDPGDLARLQERYSARLSDEAVYDLVVATKLKEVLAPNQPMRWRLPTPRPPE